MGSSFPFTLTWVMGERNLAVLLLDSPGKAGKAIIQDFLQLIRGKPTAYRREPGDIRKQHRQMSDLVLKKGFPVIKGCAAFGAEFRLCRVAFQTFMGSCFPLHELSICGSRRGVNLPFYQSFATSGTALRSRRATASFLQTGLQRPQP